MLEGISLRFPAGSRVAFVGPSGAGKSTVGALIARFYDPTAGQVLIDGRDARDCSLDWLRDQVGILLQDTVLFTGTVAENLAYGREAPREDIVRAARAADAEDFISTLPGGYDGKLGPQGIGLSGGQRQRIGIARVLLRDPPILVLDEPTTGLDAASEAQVMDGLMALMKDRTTILITHSMALARNADHIVVIERGRIAQEGTPEELLEVPGAFRRLAAEQGLVPRRRRAAPPPDPAVPAMRTLLDPDGVAPLLQRSLGDGGRIDDVRVRQVRYRPREDLTVLYRAIVDGERHEAVISTGRDSPLEAFAGDPRHLRIARSVDGRSPAQTPLQLRRARARAHPMASARPRAAAALRDPRRARRAPARARHRPRRRADRAHPRLVLRPAAGRRCASATTCCAATPTRTRSGVRSPAGGSRPAGPSAAGASASTRGPTCSAARRAAGAPPRPARAR